MNWSTEWPKDGFYWAQLEEHGAPIVVHVDRGYLQTGVAVAWVPGSEIPYSESDEYGIFFFHHQLTAPPCT